MQPLTDCVSSADDKNVPQISYRPADKIWKKANQ